MVILYFTSMIIVMPAIVLFYSMYSYSTAQAQRRTRTQEWICLWLNNFWEKGRGTHCKYLSLQLLQQYSQQMGATPLYLTMTQSRVNLLMSASAMLRLDCTIHTEGLQDTKCKYRNIMIFQAKIYHV